VKTQQLRCEQHIAHIQSWDGVHIASYTHWCCHLCKVPGGVCSLGHYNARRALCYEACCSYIHSVCACYKAYVIEACCVGYICQAAPSLLQHRLSAPLTDIDAGWLILVPRYKGCVLNDDKFSKT
jgi:hypothetical protein